MSYMILLNNIFIFQIHTDKRYANARKAYKMNHSIPLKIHVVMRLTISHMYKLVNRASRIFVNNGEVL